MGTQLRKLVLNVEVTDVVFLWEEVGALAGFPWQVEVSREKWPMILQHQHHSSADAWNVEQTMKRSQCNTNWWKDGARDLHLKVGNCRGLLNWQNMLERRSKTFNYILRINCRGIRWYVCGQRKPQKPTPMVKSISLSRKNTIQSSENFVGTDWIFQQIFTFLICRYCFWSK